MVQEMKRVNGLYVVAGYLSRPSPVSLLYLLLAKYAKRFSPLLYKSTTKYWHSISRFKVSSAVLGISSLQLKYHDGRTYDHLSAVCDDLQKCQILRMRRGEEDTGNAAVSSASLPPFRVGKVAAVKMLSQATPFTHAAPARRTDGRTD